MVLVAVLTVNVGNLRVGGSIGHGVDGGVMNLRCWRWCWLLMSGIYVLAVVLVVVLGGGVDGGAGCGVGC